MRPALDLKRVRTSPPQLLLLPDALLLLLLPEYPLIRYLPVIRVVVVTVTGVWNDRLVVVLTCVRALPSCALMEI